MNDEDFAVRSLFETWSNALNRHVSNVRDPAITEEQYKRLISEIEGVKGGINRVDKTFKKTFAAADVKNLEANPELMEDKFDIKLPVP
uniref:hypothetical protein n=1 Tax=Undibacterium luofuense TaxID=2828733 RepID=UPI0030EEBAD3